MAAKHRQDPSGTTGRTARRRWRVPALLTAAALAGTSLTFGLVSATAHAAAPSTEGQLSLTGVTSDRFPTGGNLVWVQPGGSINYSAAPVSIAANQQAIPALVGGLLAKLTGFQAVVHGLPGGDVTIGTGGVKSKKVTYTKTGVYKFTYEVKQITLLGAFPIKLDGNELKRRGIPVALNASDSWIGYAYVNKTAPKSRFSIQTPTLTTAPEVGPVQLPTVTVPGTTVTVPGVPVPSVPGVNAPLPGQDGSSSPSSGTTAPGTKTTAPKPGTKTSTSTNNPYSYDAPDCTGPCAVVPKGGSSGGQVGGASDVTLGDLGDAAASGSSGGNSASSAGDGAAAIAAGADPAGSGSDQIAVDRAFADAGRGGTTVPGLPTSLTIAAIAALAGASVLWFACRRLARG